MPMAYDMAFGNGATTTATQTTTTRFQGAMLTSTGASTPSAWITAVWAGVGGNAMTTAGGGFCYGDTWQTVGTITTTTAPNKKNVNAAASAMAKVSGQNANFAGGTGTQTVRVVINFAQTGGPGFWMAANPDLAIQVPNGGTVTGYFDFYSQTASATENFEGFWEWTEA